MRRTTIRGSLLLLASVWLGAGRGAAAEATPTAADQATPTTEVRPSLLTRSVSGRLTIGARAGYAWLAEDRRSGPNGYDNANRSSNFLGSLWGLDVEQRYLPKPFLEYRIVS